MNENGRYAVALLLLIVALGTSAHFLGFHAAVLGALAILLLRGER